MFDNNKINDTINNWWSYNILIVFKMKSIHKQWQYCLWFDDEKQRIIYNMYQSNVYSMYWCDVIKYPLSFVNNIASSENAKAHVRLHWKLAVGIQRRRNPKTKIFRIIRMKTLRGIECRKPFKFIFIYI